MVNGPLNEMKKNQLKSKQLGVLPPTSEKQYVNDPPVLSIEGIERLWHFSKAENMCDLFSFLRSLINVSYF
jgi:hypothetical protein